jgi:hypothetical protein
MFADGDLLHGAAAEGGDIGANRSPLRRVHQRGGTYRPLIG